MTQFYRGPDVVITQDLFVSKQPTYQRFAMGDLRSVRVVRASTLETVGASTPVWVCSGSLGSVGAFALLTGDTAISVPSVPTIVLIMATAVGLVTAAVRSLRSRPFELWALYRGEFVCLYRSTDRLRFGQVTRATRRVLERWHAELGEFD